MDTEQSRKQFGKQVQRYLEHYEIEIVDVVDNLKTNSTYVRKLIKGEITFSFDKMTAIASIFGLPYYKFADPDYPLPKLKDLPEETQKIIKNRANKGKITKDFTNSMALALEALIEKGALLRPTTSKILFAQIDPAITKGRKSTEITSLLAYEQRMNNFLKMPFKRVRETIYIDKNVASEYLKKDESEIQKILKEQEDEYDIT
ncbi:hypothetical protein [Myroides guanonis]|uniref:Uncharacterized protein n=1 Tax=Myroides guanonis TaxID=1150112 RepID=A0A1I3SRM3_9FLAO|nr:hypothetical protein [Myroides guanonis]SFJ60439.1 hypothetical protein SAMN04487893_11128 [Myroides guanonis]